MVNPTSNGPIGIVGQLRPPKRAGALLGFAVARLTTSYARLVAGLRALPDFNALLGLPPPTRPEWADEAIAVLKDDGNDADKCDWAERHLCGMEQGGFGTFLARQAKRRQHARHGEMRRTPLFGGDTLT